MTSGYMKEKDLRKWLREKFTQADKQRWGRLLWTEAAMGGTSGLPDCAVEFLGDCIDGDAGGPCRDSKRFELELKVWAADQGGLLISIRPAQIAYQQWKGKGGRSWFLIATNRVHVGPESAKWANGVWLLKGEFAVAGRRNAAVEKNMVRVENWADIEMVLLGR